MDAASQVFLNKILFKLSHNESLTDYESSFLRARECYLTRLQKAKYADILYLNRQFLFPCTIHIISELAGFVREFVLALLTGLTLLVISKRFWGD